MTQNNKSSAIKTWLNHKVEPWVETIETTMIVFLLGMMAIMTFANVIARFVFNSNIFWALELSVFMFAWMVLIGASFAVKKSSHLGVDALINYLPPAMKTPRGAVCRDCVYSLFRAFIKGRMGLLGRPLPICPRRQVAGYRRGLPIIFAAMAGMKPTTFLSRFLCAGWRFF